MMKAFKEKNGTEKNTILSSLASDYTEPIRDPLWRHIYLSMPFRRLIETPQFQKLSRIKQLGPAHLVYPGATHTRFSHSLGVFEIAKRLITQLVRKDEKGLFTSDGVRAFLCASLIHDMGHYPYAHSLKDLDVDPHERLTAGIILDERFSHLIRSGLGIDPRDVAAIVDHGIDAGGRADISCFRALLSGVLDPDKLDYLNRDAFFCGIPYGVQDVDFILSAVKPNEEKGIAVSAAGLVSVESILFSKYLMYKTVYWHKTVRIATAMIKKAVNLAMKDGIIKKTELYAIDDNGLFILAHKKPFPPFELVENVLARNLHKQVFRAPFDESNPSHASMENMEKRDELENTIGKILATKAGIPFRREHFIIDIPEKISFEMDVPVIDEDHVVLYGESESVFNREIVADFALSIRSISVFIARVPELLEAASSMRFEEFF